MSTTPPGGQPPDQPGQSEQGWSAPPPAGWSTSGPPPPQPQYGYQDPSAQPQWGPPPGQAAETNGKAIAALITGILSLAVCGLIGIAAIVLGNGAKNEIDRSGGRQGGRGMAVAGVVMGWIGIGLTVLAIVIFGLVLAAGMATSFS